MKLGQAVKGLSITGLSLKNLLSKDILVANPALKNNSINLKTYFLDGLIYTVVFWFFWWCGDLFYITRAVSAFYPAPALNLALLYFMGWRYVPIVYIAACMATIHLYPLWDQDTYIWFNNLRQVVVYGAAAYLLHRGLRGEQLIASSRNTLYFFAISILFSACAALGGVTIFYIFDVLPTHILFDVFFSFWAGDMTGILMLAPLTFLVAEAWKNRKLSSFLTKLASEAKTYKTLVVIIPALFSSLFFAFIIKNPDMAVYGYLIFIPLIWVAATYGAVLASITALCSNLCAAGVYSAMQGTVYSSNELHLIFAAAAAIAIFLGVSRDDRLKAESRAVEQEAALADMSIMASLGELSNTIAHEIATPLQVASSNLQMSIKQLSKSEVLHSDQLMEYQIETQQALTRAIEIHQRIRQSSINKNQARIGKTDLHQVLSEAQSLLKRNFYSAGVTVIVEESEQLPAVTADSTSMLQVFLNLFKNALSAMLDAESTIKEIHCRFSFDNEAVRIEFSDTGPGFVGVDSKRIFDSFYTTKKSGLGLGLSICRTIMEGVGGSIRVDHSKPGATFVLILPVYKEQ